MNFRPPLSLWNIALWACVSLGIVKTARCDDVAFFYALDADQKTLAKEYPSVRAPIRIGERSVTVFSVGTHKVYAVQMGAGPVETAVTAEAVLARIPVDFAISTGPIGSISAKVQRKNWYQVSSIVAYQKGTYESNGLRLGENTPISGDRPEILDKMNEIFDHPESIALASGEMFIASDTYRTNLAGLARAQGVEMNLFGLAAACANHHVPLYVWRICSDYANEHAKEDFRDFLAGYSGKGGLALIELLKSLPANKNSPSSYDNLKKLLPSD